MESENPPPRPQPEPFLPNIGFNILLPIIILAQGHRVTESAALVLVVALAFPVGYFVYDLAQRRKANFISILGFVSVLLTGGVGLFELPRFWFIVKEAAIPAIIGAAILISMATPWPLIRALLYSRKIFDVERIQEHLHAHGSEARFNRMLNQSTVFLAGSFFISAILNFLVATHFVRTEPRENPAQFNAEVASMTGWSYVIIAVPSMLMMMGILFWLIRGIRQTTGLSLEECLAPEHREKASAGA